jgi:hypothetical protein
MVTLQQISPALASKIENEKGTLTATQEDLDEKKSELQKLETRIQTLKEKIGDQQEEIRRLESRQELLDPQKILDGLLVDPVIDLQARTITAKNHRLGCFCGGMSEHLYARRARLILLCKQLDLTVVLTQSSISCDTFPIEGIMSYKTKGLRVEREWINRDLHLTAPNTLTT